MVVTDAPLSSGGPNQSDGSQSEEAALYWKYLRLPHSLSGVFSDQPTLLIRVGYLQTYIYQWKAYKIL